MVIEPVLLFLLAAIISFAGSLQPGPVNMAVVHTALKFGVRRSMLVAAGGVVPELIYSSLALWLSLLIISNEWLNTIIRLAAIVVFFTIGIIFLVKKSKDDAAELKEPHHHGLFIFGFLSGIFNPLMFPFWLMIITYVNNSGIVMLNGLPKQIAFVAGTAAGAMMLHFLAARLADYKKQEIFSLLPLGINRLLGIIFIILALWEVVKFTLH